jgi:uncharacterized protein with PIN domain
MIDLSFRFYAQLNDFLPRSRRGRRFAHVLPAPASVKDTIEALGVPHPEVDVILVNGRAEHFGYRLRAGDTVAVYPRFRTLDLGGLRRAGADPPAAPRFTLDVHLGRLAAFLRLAGFDTEVVADDAGLAASAARDDRIVLTRDVALLKRGDVRHGYWVRHANPEQQLVEVLAQFDLASRTTPFTRCLRCNTPLVAVDPETVAARLPSRTRACFQAFTRCPGCDRVYWRGSHHHRLIGLLERARNNADSPGTPVAAAGGPDG